MSGQGSPEDLKRRLDHDARIERQIRQRRAVAVETLRRVVENPILVMTSELENAAQIFEGRAGHSAKEV